MTTAKKRARYTQEQKEEIYKLFDQDLSMAQISKQTEISEMTLAAWKRDREALKEQKTEQSTADQLATALVELELVKLQNKFVMRSSKTSDDLAKAEVEIAYLLAVANLFAGGWEIKRLSELSEEDQEET